MTKEELIDCLGTFAQSGVSKFLKALKENQDLGADNGLIGIGFYSAFLVAEKVVVSTKSPRSDKQFVWESVADSLSYELGEETDPDKLVPRGTMITLYLRPDDKYEFSEPLRLQTLVKKYSRVVSYPIYQGDSRMVEVAGVLVDEQETELAEILYGDLDNIPGVPVPVPVPVAEEDVAVPVLDVYGDWEEVYVGHQEAEEAEEEGVTGDLFDLLHACLP